MELAKRFYQRYLDTHHQYLNSISDLTTEMFLDVHKKWDTSLSEGIFNSVKINKEFFEKSKQKREGNEEKAMQNMQNAWFTECALRHPVDELKERMKFASWKIVQFYYTIYTSISAMVRCIYRKEGVGHTKILMIFSMNLLTHPKLGGNFFVPPFCFYLKEGKIKPSYEVILWEYGQKHHYPYVEKCLKETYAKMKNEEIVTLYHYFRFLREWANYEDSYIFMNLYGERIRERLDTYLKTIAHAFNTLAELFLISFFGLEKLRDRFELFQERLVTNLGFNPTFLSARFEVYSKYFSAT